MKYKENKGNTYSGTSKYKYILLSIFAFITYIGRAVNKRTVNL